MSRHRTATGLFLGFIAIMLTAVTASPAVAEVAPSDQAATDIVFAKVQDRKHDVRLGVYSEKTTLTRAERTSLRGVELRSYDLVIDRDAASPHVRLRMKVADVMKGRKNVHQRYGLEFAGIGGLAVDVARSVSRVHLWKAEGKYIACKNAVVRIHPRTDVVNLKVPLSCIHRVDVASAMLMPFTDSSVLRNGEDVAYSVDQGRVTRELPLTPWTPAA